jgi:hypothetical protein
MLFLDFIYIVWLPPEINPKGSMYIIRIAKSDRSSKIISELLPITATPPRSCASWNSSRSQIQGVIL